MPAPFVKRLRSGGSYEIARTFSVLAVLGDLSPFYSLLLIDLSSQSISSQMMNFSWLASPFTSQTSEGLRGRYKYSDFQSSRRTRMSRQAFQAHNTAAKLNALTTDIPLPFLITHSSFSSLIGSSNCRHMDL